MPAFAQPRLSVARRARAPPSRGCRARVPHSANCTRCAVRWPAPPTRRPSDRCCPRSPPRGPAPARRAGRAPSRARARPVAASHRRRRSC
ncbi:MAG: hypothetical protein EPO68_13105 [Planctomycetota bacterium]|nr:MAG: hypothetical protein EPO68_13105 [Planctomycetota bacterium]